jgi:hypothetical protein
MQKFLDEKSEEERIFGEIIDLTPEQRKRLMESVQAYEFFLANKHLLFSDKDEKN